MHRVEGSWGLPLQHRSQNQFHCSIKSAILWHIFKINLYCRSGWYWNADDLLTDDVDDDILQTDHKFHVLEPFIYALLGYWRLQTSASMESRVVILILLILTTLFPVHFFRSERSQHRRERQRESIWSLSLTDFAFPDFSGTVVPKVSSADPIRDQLPGDPWIYFCNGYFEVCLSS